jgi:acyl carrier protein
MNALKEELKTKILETIDLGDLTREDIGDDAQLVGGELGLDSIDVLELVVMVEKDYGVLIDSKELGQQVFRTISTLADHIQRYRAAGDGA